MSETTNEVLRTPALAPFRVRSFRFQWPADVATSWAFEMETLILGWYVPVETQSVLAGRRARQHALTKYGCAQSARSLPSRMTFAHFAYSFFT